jgi:adenylosuccinate lyase
MSLIGERYSSLEMQDIWSREKKIITERELWIEVMRIQAELGLAISQETILDYERVVAEINLLSIDSREMELGHDVKARIEEFNALSGHEQIHLGMTSRDLTENVELMQIKSALSLVLTHT